MTQYQLDESGTVNGLVFSDMSPFIRGYITAAFWTECVSGLSMINWDDAETQNDLINGQLDGNIPSDAGFSDIHPNSLADIIADCEAFQIKAAPLLAMAYETGDYTHSQAGHDFWLTRNGHGTGFWDRKELEIEAFDYWDALPPLERDNFTSAKSTQLGDLISALCGWRSDFGEIDVTFSDTPDSFSATGYGFVFF